MKNCRLFTTIFLTVIVSSCSKPEVPVARQTGSGPENPVPPDTAFNTAFSVTDLPDRQQCKVMGSIRPDKSGIFEWEVPGKVSFNAVLPCEETVDLDQLMTTILFHDNGEPVHCSSGKPTAELRDGLLYLTVEHTAMGIHDTKNECVLKVDEFREGVRFEIGQIKLPIQFIKER